MCEYVFLIKIMFVLLLMSQIEAWLYNYKGSISTGEMSDSLINCPRRV